MSAEKNQAPIDSRDVQEEATLRDHRYWLYNRPIYIPNRSQKVKSKVLAKRNSKR